MDRREFLSLTLIFGSLGAMGVAGSISAYNYQKALKNTPNRKQTYDNSSKLVSDESLELITQSVGKIINKITYEKYRRVRGRDVGDGTHTDGSMGCGLILNKSKSGIYVLSCNHLTEVPHQIVGFDNNGLFTANNPKSELGFVYEDDPDHLKAKTLPMIIVAKDKDKDLSILRISKNLERIDSFSAYNKFADDDKVAQGDIVYSVGWPHGMANYLTTGVVSSKGGVAVFDDTFYWISSTLNPGNSGGTPSVFEKGVPYILGVNVAGYGPSMFCCVKAEHAMKLLKDNGLEKLIGE